MSASAKQIVIKPHFPSTTVQVLGDRDRLQQVVSNLLNNAVKFTPNNGQITVELTTDHDVAQIQITDTGEGISPDFLPYVFDRFRQAENNHKAHQGLGLGLAIVRTLVEQHNGSVTVASLGIKQGATFTVRLPLFTSFESKINAQTSTVG